MMRDGEPVAAQQQHRLHSLAPGEALDHLESPLVRSAAITEKRCRNIGFAASEVKKLSAVDRCSSGLNLPLSCAHFDASFCLLPLAALAACSDTTAWPTRPTKRRSRRSRSALSPNAHHHGERVLHLDRPDPDRPDGRFRLRLRHRRRRGHRSAGAAASGGLGHRLHRHRRPRDSETTDTFDSIDEAPSNGYITDRSCRWPWATGCWSAPG